MKKSLDCKKVLSLLSLFIDNKLDIETSYAVETHLLKCGECYKKYLEMKDIITNLHFEYEKLIDEFNKIENQNLFNIREYDSFYNNISPYIDNELSYDDGIKFRKYLVNSKPARKELAKAYNLMNNIKQSVSKFKNSLNINYSKKIVKRLKSEDQDSFDIIYRRAITALTVIIVCLIAVTYIGLHYFNGNFAHATSDKKTENKQEYTFPKNEDLIEFSFDENNEALITAK